jgi:hypothetical protein
MKVIPETYLMKVIPETWIDLVFVVTTRVESSQQIMPELREIRLLFVLSVLRFTDSDYPFGIFKLLSTTQRRIYI